MLMMKAEYKIRNIDIFMVISYWRNFLVFFTFFLDWKHRRVEQNGTSKLGLFYIHAVLYSSCG